MKKIILPAAFFLFLFLFVFVANNKAQSLSADDIKSQLVKEWERAKAYTAEYLSVMPADKYVLKANDSVRSFGQQMLHLASGNVFLMSNATGEPMLPWVSFDIDNRPGAQKPDSVAYYVNASYDYCINAVKNSDISKWSEKKKMFGAFEETRFALMIKCFEHQTHHRGQTTIYIRLAGIKPPQEKLF